MATKESALQKITALVSRFEEQIGSYKKTEYNETLTRRDFIDPFFKALGWDMDNEQGYAEAYREVIHEDKLKIGSATKAPDYSFRLPGGKRLFFVEAKKPSVFVKEEIPPAYQVRRYGWSAKLPVSIVTDFEEFSVYDCTKKPKQNDKASNARIKYLTYKDYLTEFDFLWDTFSKERVLQGSFDKFVLSDTGKKGTATVDKEFLESLNEWRKLLAETISLNNKKLNEDEINFAVQQTLDRIIFLRIAEDRSVEPYGKLKDALRKGDYYKNLFEYFEEADRVYNSGLFDFKKDELSKYLKIENSVLEKIINELYYPESPYEFSVLSVEILGSAYEQFLGKVIRLTPSHKAKIEEKPEVRKAGGVYYTPQYIVDYIVKNTVGKLVEGKTPKEVEKLKIVDPACGSGSFLIGAFQYLLDWHLSYYTKGLTTPLSGKAGLSSKSNPADGGTAPLKRLERDLKSVLTPDGRLTTAEKKKILINNLYGVDIDTQAVEVTKLSLLLKCMEGETQASVQQTMGFVKERVLPTLDNNIKCGNSLIDTDFYDGVLEFAGTDRKIKPFNWQNAFPEVFKQGGFDCVIGNPPWVFTRDVEWPDVMKDYFWNKFSLINENNKSKKNQSGKINLFILFLLQSSLIINKNGFASFIIPNGLLRTTTYDTTRKFLIEKTSINKIVDLKSGVFEGVTASSIIIILSKYKKNNKIEIIDANYKEDQFINEENITYISQDKLINNVSYTFNIFVNEFENDLFNKLTSGKSFLKDIIVDIIEGIVAHKKFIENKRIDNRYKQFLEGKDIKRYTINFNSRFILFDRKKLHRPRPDYIWEANKKIIIQRISGGKKPLVATIDTKHYYTFASTNLLLIKKEIVDIYSYELICAILNSSLLNFYYSKNFSNASGLTVNISKTFLEMLPLPSKVKIITYHDEMVKLVDTMLELNNELQKLKLPGERESLQQRIDHTDRRIDKLVYELYGLTEEEIKIVEGV